MYKGAFMQFKDQKNPKQSINDWVEEPHNSAEYGICIYVFKQDLSHEFTNEEILLFEKELSQLNTMFY